MNTTKLKDISCLKGLKRALKFLDYAKLTKFKPCRMKIGVKYANRFIMFSSLLLCFLPSLARVCKFE